MQSSLTATGSVPRRLATYIDGGGRLHELISRSAAGGTVLVIDRDQANQSDERLLAHLWADEPSENALLVCRHYLGDTRVDGRRCRPLGQDDLSRSPLSPETGPGSVAGSEPLDGRLIDQDDGSCALQRIAGRTSILQLRWCRGATDQPEGSLEPLSLRDVIAHLEGYEPARTITRRALALHGEDPEVSTAVLRAELARVEESPIVLNRKLREVVLATVAREELSMSEIAIRCGRIKRDGRGNESGETSWLARRLGLMSEGGSSAPTPWIHSQVLGLIARRGLGICPCEVEV